MEHNELEIDKIIEKMFIYADNKDLNTNRFRSLIVNPQILRVLIHQMASMSASEKIQIIAKVGQIYKQNSLNACILYKRDREIIQFNHSIFDEIISFIFGIKAEFQDNHKIFQKIKPLISQYPVSCRNVKNLISKIAKNFHFESFNIQKLQLCLWILRQVLKCQPAKSGEPKCFFYIYGPNSGIRMINQNMKWTLHKGMHFYIRFSMEGKNEEESSLLSISVNDDLFELGIDAENYLTIRVFSASKISKLRKLQRKKWYFLKLSYCLKTGIIRNTYELLLHIQGEPFELRDLPIPSPTMKDNIDQLVIGHEFYGKINFATISRNELHFWPKEGINKWDQIEKLLCANKQQIKDIFLFYSPLITSRLNQNELIYEITNKNHAEILENTAVYINPFDEVDINYYGGIYTFLPFFYILRFYEYNHYTTALQQMIDLIVIIFEGKYQNVESEAINCQLFGILAEFFNKVDERYITETVLDKISTLKQLISENTLLKQYLKSFLLKLRVQRISNIKIVQKIHRLISSFYFNNFSWALQIASLYDIIWYTIDNFQPQKRQDCCILHCSEQNQQGLDDNKIFELQQHYKIRCDYLKELIKYIIKKLCSTRKYDLLIPKIQMDENGLIKENKKDTFSIFEFLKFQGYSICLKKMLLECFQVGVEEDPQTLMRDTILLECLYGLLSQAELRDQITPVISVLGECSKILNLTKDARNLQIITKIGKQLDKIYMKKYAQIRLRSKSQGIGIKRLRITDRKISNEFQDTLGFHSEIFDKEKQIKNKIIKFKNQKKIQISNDKELYDILMSICCTRNDRGDIILIDDNCAKIINSYFKICSMKFKVKLIEIIRTTVLITKSDKVPSKMQTLAKYDQIYRFVLSQFILKQLDPEDSSYRSQQSTYIIKNFFYIVDHMVTCMKKNWDSLYLFILRMIGLLTQAKKDIHKKTERSKAEILTACKVCVRKFILRVLQHSQKSIQNMGNMVFLVFLIIFNNHQELDQKQHMFDYFQSLEEHLFIGPISIKNQDEHIFLDKSIFIDNKIILAYLDGFKMEEVFKKQFDSTKHRKYTMNLIQTYFQFKKQDDLQDYLFKLRKVFSSKTKFRDITTDDNKGIRNIISNLIIGNDEEKDAMSSQLYVSQIIGLLLCLVIESSLKGHHVDFLKQALQKCELFMKALTLSCSRDCLRKRDHQLRNEKLPSRVVYYVVHFIYEMIETDCHEDEKNLLQETLYCIMSFMTQIMSILSDKVGNPNTIQEIITFSQVMQDVEEYNYFLFSVLKNVITVNEIRMYSTLPKQKAVEVLRHPQMKKHFKEVPTIFLQKHIQQSAEIHDHNIKKVQKELQEKFREENDFRKNSSFSNVGSESNQFQEYRLDHARRLDFDFRNMMKVWRKIWKRLRLYHYYWSVSMDQKQSMQLEWQKVKTLPYKHKFGKYTDLDGVRPILEVEPNQPWHVKKAQLEQEVKYRSANFMVNLYKPKEKQTNLKPKSFIYKLLNKETSDFFMVQWIKHNSKRKGRIYITAEKLIFQYDSTFQKDSHMDFTSFTLAQHRPIEKVWSLVTIVNILKRRYLMRKQCLFIEFEDSSHIVFDFLNDDSDEFLQKIEQVQAEKSQMVNFMKANKITFYLKRFRKTSYLQEIQEITEQWCNGKITNFHYLMLLNKYSGRSYLDPVNYPVMPWIVANYDFKQMVYRDLSKSLGALGSQTRRQFYENKVQTLDPFSNVPPYQYGTHYSSPGVVFNFLIRISPYTQAGRTLQGERFDLSDRLFSSIKVCWNSVKNETSDVRELNPEFFYLPEFLLNIENYDFGMTQLQERIDNVKLPLWSANAYEFICNHRRALEGDEVSNNINNWIDLIFGYKQKGKIAKDNLNLYYYLTYEDAIDLEKIDDPVQKTSIEAQIIHFGQTPSQLFLKPHPEKKFLKSSHPYSEPQKIKFIGLIDSQSPIILLGETEGNLVIFNDYSLLVVSTFVNFQIKSQVSLLRNTSKEKLYFIEDASVYKKIALFGNGKFIIVASYVNGDIAIYNLQGKKVHQKKGTVKSVIYINQKQNLLICGSKNGLLEVYEIVYGDKDSVNLTKIVSQYYMFPIEHISEGAGFFAISSGNLIIINKITRGMNYVHDKVKMQGSKMIRSFQSKRKVHGSFICTNPLYCVFFFNSLQFYIYSINGQFLKLRQIQSLVNPIIIVDYMHRQNILALQPNGLIVMKIPQLETVLSIPVPNKEYTDMKVVKDKVYLMTSNGEILYLFNQKEVIFS